MTTDRIALRELLKKSSDIDLLCEMIGFVADRRMAAEVEGLCGAGHGERAAGHGPPSAMAFEAGGGRRGTVELVAVHD